MISPTTKKKMSVLSCFRTACAGNLLSAANFKWNALKILKETKRKKHWDEKEFRKKETEKQRIPPRKGILGKFRKSPLNVRER